MAPSDQELERMQREQAVRDSLDAIAQAEGFESEAQRRDTAPGVATDEQTSVPDASSLGSFAATTATDTLITTVETPYYRMHFTTAGGGPAQIKLLQHDKYDGSKVTLIADSLQSAYNIGFLSTENYNINSQDLLFQQRHGQQNIRLEAGQEERLVYDLELEDGRTLTLEYHINGDGYQIGLDVYFDGMSELISGSYYEFGWQPRLLTTEESRDQEVQYSAAYVYLGDVMENIQLLEAGSERESITGNIRWVATKSKFFTQIIKPEGETDGSILIADVAEKEGELLTHYRSLLRSAVPQSGPSSFNLYIGPLDYIYLDRFDEQAYDMVDTGFRFLSWFSDPFVHWIILPFFTFFGGLLPNFGLVIILFAFLVKLVLYPLTKKSFESMAAMRELQPEMKALQEKYKDDPQAQQQATMKLFKKAKVNPLGGCLPNLLQAPVLITLWRYFQNSIEIRQESFLWAQDLSAPDVILNLPFTVPLLGSHIAGFVLLMALSMVVQMRISGGGAGAASNPQMKIFQYVLPVILFVFFNQFASGLSLYYLIFNTLSIGQQMLINKQIDHVKMMETVDKKQARKMAKEQKKEERQKLKEARIEQQQKNEK